MSILKMASAVFVSALIISSAAALGQERAAESPRRESLLAEIRKHDTGLTLWWTGNDGWLIKSVGVLIDRVALGGCPPRAPTDPNVRN